MKLSNKDLMKYLFSAILILCVAGQIVGLYNGSFENNQLPIKAMVFDLVLLLACFAFSIDKVDSTKAQQYTPRVLKQRIQNNMTISKKILIAQKKRDLDLKKEKEDTYQDTMTLTPIEVKETVTALRDNTQELDSDMIEAINSQRYKYVFSGQSLQSK
jgi:hypothetical protein